MSSPLSLRVRVAACACVLLAAPALALAADPFTVRIDVDGNVTQFGFKRLENVLDALDTATLSRLNPRYTGSEAATLDVGFRGLPVVLSYPSANNARLVFAVPSLGITQVFDGATRDQSEDLLDDYLTNNAAGILDRLFRELARVSPVDPIAGNPNSLMSQIVANDFAGGVAPITGGKDDTGVNNLIGLGVRVGSFSQGGLRSNTYTLPLSYTMRADLDPRRQFTINLPITYVDVAGAKAYSVAPGLAYRHPMNDQWTLSPAVGLGVTASEDLASLGAVAAFSLTSAYVFTLHDIDFTLGNLVGHYRTVKTGGGDFSANPRISNTVLKNGLAATLPMNGGGRALSVEVGYAHTHFFGTELYAKNYHELSVNVGTNASARSARSHFRAGASYVKAGDTKGFHVNLGFWF